MSQFLLAQGVDAALLPGSAKITHASTDPFLLNAAERLFGSDAAAEVVTVLSNGEDIDGLLLRAQHEVNEGRDYLDTELHKLLIALTMAAKRFVLWYGSDFLDLAPIRDVDTLTRAVRDGLSSSSVEVYAAFERE